MHKLFTDGAVFKDACRPRDHTRDSTATSATVGLERRKRRIRHFAPTGWVERRALRAAQLMRLRPLLLYRRIRQTHETPVIVEHTQRPPRIRASVVGGKQDDGVVELAQSLQCCD